MTDSKINTGITIGNFDGVHKGHREVIRRLKDACSERNLRPLVVTFDRHPLCIVDPSRAPGTILSPEQKVQTLKDMGVDVLMLAFDRKLRELSSGEFMKFLHEYHAARMILLGYDNRFGHDRDSGPEQYLEEGAGTGMEIIFAGEIPGVSSSVVRKMIADGDVENAMHWLTRPYFLNGTVEHGDKIGRTLGFPTANLRLPDESRIIPANGVYAALAVIENNTPLPAVVNIGVRPTISGSGQVSIEAHILGFNSDIYGKEIYLHFITRIRDEKKMESLDALKSAIATDISSAHGIIDSLPAIKYNIYRSMSHKK